MRLTIVAMLILIAGCSREQAAEDAENQFDMVNATAGSSGDKCEAARRAADAWLKRGDQAKYAFWRLQRDLYCDAARTRP